MRVFKRREALLLSSAVMGVLCFAAIGARAQAPAAYQFDIPAESLSQALKDFSTASSQQILFSDQVVGDRKAPALHGSYTRDEALGMLLAGTDLHADVSPSGVIMVRPKNVQAAQNSGAASSNIAESETVVITGTRLQGVQASVPITTIDQVQMAKTGQTTLAGVLNSIPEVSLRSTTDPAQGGVNNLAVNSASTVSLRGLPTGTTLVLLDGQRVAPSALQSTAGVFNLDLLPMSAVERIDVLASGSSAIYGGDALGGVVNFVTKRDFDGASFDARFGGADGYEEGQLSAAFGRSFERGNIALFLDYRNTSTLARSERDVTSSTDFSRFGGPDIGLPYSYPGNIYSLTSSNIPGLGATSAGIPVSTTGTVTAQNFLATAGKPNLSTAFLSQNSILPATKEYGALLSGNYQITSNLNFVGSVLFSQLSEEINSQPLYVAGQSGSVVIPASNPNNPFGVPLGLNYVFNGAGPAKAPQEQQYVRVNGGIQGNILDWDLASGVTYTESDDSQTELVNINPSAVNSALSSPSAPNYFNPFTPVVWSRSSVTPFLSSPIVDRPSRSLLTLDANVSRSIYDLPGGPWRLLIGGEYDRDSLDYASGSTTIDKSRGVFSGFAETHLPLMSFADGGPERLVVTAAARYDSYDNFGGQWSYQAGLEFRPIETILLRGNYSTSYLPPSLYQLYRPQTSSTSLVFDTLRGTDSYVVPTTTGGNPNLKAENGRSYSLGAVWAPEDADGFQLSVNQWSTSIDNYAASVSLANLLANQSLFPQYIQRAAPSAADTAAGYPGRITSLFFGVANFGQYTVSGVDMSAQAAFDTSIGILKPEVDVTNTYEYQYSLVPAKAPTSELGKANTNGYAPDWKATGQLSLDSGPSTVTFIAHYTGSYQDSTPSTNKIGDFWLFDLTGRYDLSEIVGLNPVDHHDVALSAGIRNIANDRPVFSEFNLASGVGYDPTQYDIVGRYMYVQLSLKY